ncbi:transglycosylase domain-containing protein [Solirubrobacter sp. CPCC 204708]|uniref:Transglycosylase domain-containing protein n=1 Tax=Solirubrobacter deserti TaxID=2282478 RepID=A0ABT4RC06_9ACTN|nr:transglycosylase domain-containing protein [Solirubrobacter deserti]MBE2317047.1 transglycosylase domain-containing protein [Solirubrobacter deserti]MDA0136061.1 transglycosylase domain-containing protein [Solirubrobacter deserti]
MAFLLLILLGVGTGLAAAGWVVRTANDGPELSTYTPRNPGGLTKVLAADGTRLGFIQNDELIEEVEAKDFPEVLNQATVAIEDERFYKHTGVDYEGIIRAAYTNATSENTQGGSTLTMQLVRNLYTQDVTRSGIEGYKRKIREARLAQQLEEEHSKAWVLGKYLNTVPYGTYGGQTAVGAGAAARLYFNKHVKDLTLREAAMIAGMPQAPSDYSPVNNPEGTTTRRNEVLGKMAELGYITREKAEREMKKDLGLDMDRYFQRARERYVLDFVKSELIKEYGLDATRRGGFTVTTTINLKYQQYARSAMSQLAGVGPSSAIVTIDPKNGDILTMASTQTYGRSKGKSTFNLAAQGKRQPGSAFKTMALMAALREGVNPSSTTYTSRSPMRITKPPCGSPQTPWELKTYSGSGAGTMDLAEATTRSDNSVYAQLVSDLGPDKVKETARLMGIKSKLLGVCAESLGGLTDGVSPLEMANAYATIVNGGYRTRPRVIKKIERNGERIKLPKRWRIKRTKAFEDGVTDQAVKILASNITGGTGGKAQIPGCNQGGKTGTTDKNIDAWFVGFTPRRATAVWVGFPGSAKISMNGMYFGSNIDGGTYPAQIWGDYMKKVVANGCGEWRTPKEPFNSQPFQGRYAREGLDDDEAGEGEQGTTPGTGTQPSPPATQQPSDPEPRDGGDGERGNGGGNGNGDNDARFDPGAYETQPQGPPGNGGTQAPGDG